MLNEIKIKAPAKINLTLEVLNKRDDGFHNIQSIMQAINLYDIISIKLKKTTQKNIILTGNSNEIPYDDKNIAFKAANLFLTTLAINNYSIFIDIEKNIPVCAGLAGGSADAAGVLYGLNLLFNKILNNEKLHALAAQLGSDLNFCIQGGCALCTGRGEKIEKLPVVNMPVSLIKPKYLGVSAKEAYLKFSQMKDKTIKNYTLKLKEDLLINNFSKANIYNSLEKAVFYDYKELQDIKSKLPCATMSGSGPTFFVLDEQIHNNFNSDNYLIIENLNFISEGVSIL